MIKQVFGNTHFKDSSRNEGSLVRTKEPGCIGDVFWFSDSLHGKGVFELLEAFLRALVVANTILQPMQFASAIPA